MHKKKYFLTLIKLILLRWLTAVISQQYFDLDDLNHFREELRNGNMENEFHYRRPEIKIEVGICNEDSSSHDSEAPETTRVQDSPSRAKYTAYDTQASHSHSSNNSFGQTRGQNRNGAKPQYYRASQEPLNPPILPSKARAMTALQKYLTNSFPAPVATYAHDAEVGCIYSVSSKILVLPRSLVFEKDKEKYERMMVCRKEYDANWGNIPELKTEHARLLGEVQVTKLAKGVFLKRCNGMYVNGLGEIAEPEVVSTDWETIRDDARVVSRVLRESKSSREGADSGYQGSEAGSEGSGLTVINDGGSYRKKMFENVVVDDGADEDLRFASLAMRPVLYSNKPNATTTNNTVHTDSKQELTREDKFVGDEPLPLSILQAIEHSIATVPNARNSEESLIQRCWCHKNMLPLDSIFHTDTAAWSKKSAREREWECKRWVVFKD